MIVEQRESQLVHNTFLNATISLFLTRGYGHSFKYFYWFLRKKPAEDKANGKQTFLVFRNNHQPSQICCGCTLRCLCWEICCYFLESQQALAYNVLTSLLGLHSSPLAAVSVGCLMGHSMLIVGEAMPGLGILASLCSLLLPRALHAPDIPCRAFARNKGYVRTLSPLGEGWDKNRLWLLIPSPLVWIQQSCHHHASRRTSKKVLPFVIGVASHPFYLSNCVHLHLFSTFMRTFNFYFKNVRL